MQNRIFIVFIWLVGCCVAYSEEQWATIRGRVIYDGPEQILPKLQIVKDLQAAGMKRTRRNESFIVDPTSGGLKNVVVWLDPAKNEELPIHPELQAIPHQSAEIVCEKLDFHPRINIVRTRQRVRIVNKDAVVINFDAGDLGHNLLIIANGKKDLIVNKELRTPGRIGDAIHPWMTSFIMATDHPYVAVTNANGQFTIKNAPVGKWRIRIWHERAGFLKKSRISGKGITQNAANRSRLEVDVQYPKGTRNTIRVDAESLGFKK